MKKAVVLFLNCFILMGYGIVSAQDNADVPYLPDSDITEDVPDVSESDIAEDVPYLSESDITAIETVLPEDTLIEFNEGHIFNEGHKIGNEMPRLNTAQPIYHLLVLDRVYCPNSDIGAADGMRVLYKYRHGRNGYLIALYVSPADGPVFPQLPARSRIVLNLSTARQGTIREYINSNAFRRFVTNRTIRTQLQEALRRTRAGG